MHANLAKALFILSAALSTSGAAIHRNPFVDVSSHQPEAAPVRYLARNGDPLRLEDSQVQQALNNNGITDGIDPNTSPAMTSNNNFINFCLSQPVPLTNGQQVEGGSCNPTPIGRIVAKSQMPSSKFKFPKNGYVLEANTAFTVQMAVRNFATGIFTNAKTNYFANPQTVNDQGLLVGHSHVVIEFVNDYHSEDPLEPQDFAFFKAMNTPAIDGVLSAEVTDGLNPGVYRMASINTSASHQPAVVAVAQHGHLEDMVYFQVVTSEEFNNQDPDQEGNDDNETCVSESTS
jgi:hypothetical protein